MSSSLSAASARGLFAGAGAGVWVAFADYGATWLWLPVYRDRAWLLVRVLASLVPIGAALGALSALLGVLAWRLALRVEARAAARERHDAGKRAAARERHDAAARERDDARARRARLLWPLPFVLLALVPSALLAAKLCSGGMMSRLSKEVPIELALRVVLPATLYGVLWAGAWAGEVVARARERNRLACAGGLLVCASLLEKLNQVYLPNLYDYLHGLLALAVWALAALGLALALFSSERGRRLGGRLVRRVPSWSLALACIAVACINALTLDQSLNVRVALFDARAAATRALLASADPLLRRLEQRSAPRARAAVAQRGERLVGAPLANGAHVLLVTIDALRADHLGTYGYARPVSPELDAFARGALTFERGYAQAPHSSYSLSSLHTSAYVHELVELARPLPQATLASALADHGYHTAAFFTDGIFHTEGAKLTQLRDSAFAFALFDQTNREAEQQTDRVLAEVERIKQRGEPPSLLWVHYFDVHEPYQETTFGSDDRDRYDSEILHTDRELARLIRELEARFTRELVIAITADHGEEFREHGGVYHGSTLYDEQVRVPLLLRAPRLGAGRVATPVEVIDIAPTLLATVGAPIPASMRGRDLRAIAADARSAAPVFSAVLTKRMALRWPYKLIADLRFDLFELYDLSTDPLERHNLAGETPARVAELRELVYGWLDSVEAGGSARDQGTVQAGGSAREQGIVEAGGSASEQDTDSGSARPQALGARTTHNAATEWERALRLGRLGDRRAVPATAALLLDGNAPIELRSEAGQNLAKLADPSALPALLEALERAPEAVAAEAAVALGRMYDERARPALRRLMHAEDPYLRARAAVSLGRLRDRAAVPALIDALWVAPTQYEREEAVRWLGRLRDPAAVEPLLSLLPEFGLRYLLAVALGQIGDARAYDALVGMLAWETRTNIRDEVVRGLGLLGDARAIPMLVELLDREPALNNTAESLVRLGALPQGALGGLDVAPHARGLSGFADCVEGPLIHDWDYLQRTFCTTRSATAGPARGRATLELRLPTARSGWSAGAQLVLRLRRADRPEPVRCELDLAGIPLDRCSADGEFRELRWELPRDQLAREQLSLVLRIAAEGARISIDHALIVPHWRPSASASAADARPPHVP